MLNGTVHHFYSTSREKTPRRVEDDKINLREIQGERKVPVQLCEKGSGKSYACNNLGGIAGWPLSRGRNPPLPHP